MKQTFRNFIHTISRFKTSSILNILGLSVAFAAFIIIMVQINFTNNFDRYHTQANQIYRIDRTGLETGDMFAIIQPRGLLESVANSSPHVKASTLINPFVRDHYFLIDDNGTQKGIKENVAICQPEITQIFDFEMLEGTADCLSKPENVMIPESMARRLFGNQLALGKQLTLTNEMWTKANKNLLVVGGVYKDLPANTQLNNYIYTAIDEDYGVNNWQSSNFMGYVLLDDKANAQEVADNFNANFDFNAINKTPLKVKLTPLTSIYYMNESQDEMIVKSGNPTTPIVLLTIAILIIVIAIINFVNFSMALAPMRIKSINIRKVLGSENLALRIELIIESILLSLVAFALSILIATFLSQQNVLSFLNLDVSSTDLIIPVAITFVIALCTSIVAGIRPAHYITSFSPALVLKGNFGLTPSGKKLRTTLIGLQFFISITLIIVSGFIYKQNSFMFNYSLGFDTDQVVIVELDNNLAGKNKLVLVNSLKENANIVDVAFAQEKLGASDNYRGWEAIYENQKVQLLSLSVSWNFLDVMGIKPIDGRTFSENDTDMPFIINKSMVDKYTMKTGDYIEIGYMKNSPKQIIGVMDDINITSLRNTVSDMVFTINDNTAQNMAYIQVKAGANIGQIIKHINTSIGNIDPAYPVKVEFYDTVFENLYKQENNSAATIALFCLLAVLISIVGVFGLVMFECEYKRREIGIRKVLGATIGEVLIMFNKSYLIILGVCLAISVPVAYYIVSEWLANFAYKTALSWWVFLVAGLILVTITCITVTIQSYRAATTNPVDALKSE